MDKRFVDQFGEGRALWDAWSSGMATAIPGVIQSFNAVTNLASVQPAIRMKTVVAGVVSYIDLPVIDSVPICLPGSVIGGLFLTVPIKTGDPCLLIFSQRGIDNVVQSGGIQNPPDGASPANCTLRHHDLTDAICVPCLLNVPAALASWSDTAAELRNADGTVKVSVNAQQILLQAGTTTVTVSSTGVTIVGPVGVTGEVTANLIPLSTHEHPQVGSKPGFTGGPTPP